jgi:hypothetical protein
MFAAAMWKVGAVGENSVVIGSILRLFAGLMHFLICRRNVSMHGSHPPVVGPRSLGILKIESL